MFFFINCYNCESLLVPVESLSMFMNLISSKHSIFTAVLCIAATIAISEQVNSLVKEKNGSCCKPTDNVKLQRHGITLCFPQLDCSLKTAAETSTHLHGSHLNIAIWQCADAEEIILQQTLTAIEALSNVLNFSYSTDYF